MPISSLNKVVALLIVGGVALLWIGVILWQPLSEFALRYKDLGTAAGAVVVGLLLLAGSALLGSVIEGVTDLTFRRLVKKAHRQRSWAGFFGQSDLHDGLALWEEAFVKKAREHDLFRSVLAARESASMQLAAGIFHKNATKEHIDWLVTHYSMYYLATNYLVLLTLIGLSAPLVNQSAAPLVFALITAGLLLCTYFTWSLAVDRYLYSYLVTFRFGVLCLNECGTCAEQGHEKPEHEKA